MKENNDCTRGRRLTDVESLYFMLSDIPDYSEILDEVCKPFIKIEKEDCDNTMSESINEDINHVLGRKYNVEYLDGQGRCQTFNNTLTNIDNTYFWFESEQTGLALVKQDRVTFMYCTEPHVEKNKMNFNSYMKRDRINQIDEYFQIVKRNNSVGESLARTCKAFNLYYCDSLYKSMMNNIDTTENNFMRTYLKYINNLRQYKGKTFQDSEFLD
jgi:hypothetical protein